MPWFWLVKDKIDQVQDSSSADFELDIGARAVPSPWMLRDEILRGSFPAPKIESPAIPHFNTGFADLERHFTNS